MEFGTPILKLIIKRKGLRRAKTLLKNQGSVIYPPRQKASLQTVVIREYSVGI